MNAVERLQAAIEKLEAAKVAATPGPWFLTYERSTHPRVWGNYDGEDADPVARADRSGNAELLVILHRTIDAQLAVLREGIREVHRSGTYQTDMAKACVALADAILGGA